MNISELTSWHVVDKNERTTLVAAPFCMRDGGEMISFYIHKTFNGGYIVTDEGFCSSYADMYSVNLTETRKLMMQRKSHALLAQFDLRGAIVAHAESSDDLEYALVDAMRLALAVSYEIDEWLPVEKSIGFIETLQSKIIKSIPGKEVVKKLKVKGLSHNDIEVPLAVIRKESKRKYLIETVAENTNWGGIYGIQGRFSDIKLRDSEEYSRFVIFENDANMELVSSARNLLTSVAHTRVYDPDEDWDKIFVA